MTTDPSADPAARDGSERLLRWPSELVAKAGRVAVSVEDFLDDRWRELKRRKGWTGTPQIQPYYGYRFERNGVPTARVIGRVLSNPPLPQPTVDDDWWTNLTMMYRRFESDECPGVAVAIESDGARLRTVTGREGYFDVEVAGEAGAKADNGDGWRSVRLSLPEAHETALTGASGSGAEVAASEIGTVVGSVLQPSPEAEFGVISDIDDTVLFTGVTDLATMARLTFLHSARMRKPLPGVASLYQALQSGSRTNGPAINPVFYVSSSPWNLFDLLVEFLELNDIPLGPILLRDFGFSAESLSFGDHSHKRTKAEQIMAAYPSLRFVLIGDSGQQDASLYADIAEQQPDRIAMILIRDVDPNVATLHDSRVEPSRRKAAEAGVALHVIEDSAQAADHLKRAGLLAADAEIYLGAGD